MKQERTVNSHFSNSITFTFPVERIQLGIYTNHTPGRKKYSYDFLKSITGNLSETADNQAEAYWVGEPHEKMRCAFTIRPQDEPGIGKWFCHEKLFQQLVIKTDVQRTLLTGDRQYWIKTSEQTDAAWDIYNKFSIYVILHENKTNGWLQITWDGTSSVLRSSVQELVRKHRIDTNLLGLVVHKKQCRPYNKINSTWMAQSRELYPVLNRDLAYALNLKLPVMIDAVKLKTAFEKVESFRKEIRSEPASDAFIQISDGWAQISDMHIKGIADKSRLLKFGQGKINSDIYRGFKASGPYQLPDEKHFRVFFIYCKNGLPLKTNLQQYLDGSIPGKDLLDFSRLNLGYNPDIDIVTDDASELVSRVEKHLATWVAEENTRYFAFYISPFSRFAPDAVHKKMYYTIKEALLKRGIMMQSIEMEKNNGKSLALHIPNIAIAMVAKLGGIPWKLARETNRELIVGIGAYKTRNEQKPYLGSAFCFDNEGKFQEFDCWPARDTWALAGMIRKALLKYGQKYQQANRLIIHYYKESNRKEMQAIEDMLDDIGLKIPVIVVHINSTFRHKELVFNPNHALLLPENGNYISLPNHQYLLFMNNNNGDGAVCKSAPYPLKVSLKSNQAGLVGENGVADAIMQQLYDFTLLHWRSVKQPRLPVTIAYPRMLARIFPHFRMDVLPENETTSLWFL